MKLRIHENSIRLRLKPSEVASLRNEGKVEDTLWFGAGVYLAYGLKVSSRTDVLETDFAGNRLRIFVPEAWVAPWADSEQEGFEGVQPIEGGETLRISVEKDYKCLHRPMEAEEGDIFPHPLAEEG